MLRERTNRLWIGLVSGVAVPVLVLTIYYFTRYSDLSLVEFLRVYKSMGILTHIVSLAVLPDLLVFFLFIRQKMLRSARGILMATFLMTFLVLCIRFF